jgi:hypothetical protein
MSRIEGSKRAAVFVPVLLVHVVYSVFVIREARRRGLLDGSGSQEAGPAA